MLFQRILVATVLLSGIHLSLNAQQYRGWRHQEMEAVTLLSNPSQVEVLHQLKLNADMPASLPGLATLYLTPAEKKKVDSAGLVTNIVISDLRLHYEGWWDRDVPPGYYTYQQIINTADSLAAAYPAFCKKVLLGNSVGGLQLAALKISDNAATDEPEPEIMFEAGIHGDEVGGPENLIRFARDLCKGYGNNTQITDLINNREIWLWLMVNPDGRQSMSRYNDNNVDINRDGGYMWNGEGNSPGAWSQVETKTMRDFCSENQFVVFSDYHSGTEYISYPWSYRADIPPDKPSIHHLASVYASASGYNNIPYAQGYSGMYPINGSTKDFNYGSLGSVSWSIEISMLKQPPSSTINSYYQKNKPAMLALVEKAALGISGMVTDSLSGLPVSAIIMVNQNYPCYNDPVVGDFHKYLIGGTYNIVVSAPGYVPRTYSNVVVPANGSLSLPVVMQRQADTSWARKVMGCYILNNNPNDEGYTPGIVGPADNIRYSLGKNGWVVLDMGDTIVNKPGDDLRVVEDDGTNEGYTVWAGATVDGPWVSLGNGTGTTSFDLGSVDKARYLKIKDSGSGSTTVPDAGVDVDAVENLHPGVRALFKAQNYEICQGGTVQFLDLSRGNPLWWNWHFEGAVQPASSDQNPVVTYSQPGTYKVVLTAGDQYTQASVSRESYITVLAAPVVNLGTDTLLCYDYQHLTLDAGNTGSSYLWNTGETTQTIETQCSGIDVTDTYVATVTATNGCSSSDSVEVTCTICEGVAAIHDQLVAVYPNPVDGQLHISVGNITPFRATLTDETGRTVLKKMITEREAVIQTNDLRAGCYFLLIEVDGMESKRFKLMKI